MHPFANMLSPLSSTDMDLASRVIVLMLVASAMFILAGTLAMPEGYSWLTHSISESAAQAMPGAWIARLGFLLFGCGVLWLAITLRSVWARSAYWMHMVFALSMIGTAAFSHKPWLEGVPFDSTEDFLHSFTATLMGFAFSFGVVLRFLQRQKNERLPKLFDVIALAIATFSSPLGMLLPSIPGLIQRVMFVVGYLWYAHEALTARDLKNPVDAS